MSIRPRLVTLICLMSKEKWFSKEILRPQEAVICLTSSSSTSTDSKFLMVKLRHSAKILMPQSIAMITYCKETVVWRKNLQLYKNMQTWFNFKTKIFRENSMNSSLLMILSDLDLIVAKKLTTLDSVLNLLSQVPSLTLTDQNHLWEVAIIEAVNLINQLNNNKMLISKINQLPPSIMITCHKAKLAITLLSHTDALLRAKAHH